MLKDNQKPLIRFCIVGGVNTLIDLGIFTGLHYGGGVGIMVSHVSGVTLAVLNSYLMNKYWTFGDTSPHNPKQIVKFLSVAITALGLSSLTIYIAKAVMPVLLAKLVAIGVTMVWNYIGNRFFVFIQRETRR